MALVAGTRLGPYEVVTSLGAGGMGEVYRARDTRLERTVAIKVLNSALTASPDLTARFEREAKTISQLNHPHICTLYDVGHQDGTDFLVMEFLEGESLADRLKRGPLPLKELVSIGCNIADALDRAHRAGIVHRDLKPGNVMLTKTGAKLLDFGLAKPAVMGAAAGSGSAPLLSAAMTMTSPSPQHSPLTQQGALVGTVQYMSPEQIQGIEADARSDIFAFGAVLYEMATGRRAFEGKSQIKVASAILEDQPAPLNTPHANTPAELERVISTCLQKDPEQRFQCARDLKLQLQWVDASGESKLETPAAATQEVASPERSAKWIVATAVLAAVLAAAAVIAWVKWPPPVMLEANILPPDKQTFTLAQDDGAGPLVLSPDGKQIAFVARDDAGDSRMYVRSLDEKQPKPIAGTENAIYPFWSYDGKSLGFYSNGKLRRVAVAGGPVLDICQADRFRGGAWAADDTIYFTPDTTSPIMRVAATPTGASPAAVTTIAAEHTTHRWPYLLPGGKHLLYLASNHSDPTGNAKNGIYFSSLDGKESRFVVSSDSNAILVRDRLMWVQNGSLLTQKFDPTTGSVSGQVTPIVIGVGVNSSTWRAGFDATENGILIYQPGESGGNAKVELFDREGKELADISNGVALDVRISPDGRRAAVLERDPAHNIWMVDLDKNTRVRFNFESTSDGMAWSADSRFLYYVTVTKNVRIYRKPVDGSGPEQVLFESQSPAHVSDISADGKYLLFEQRLDKMPATTWVLPLSGSEKPRPLISEPVATYMARFSPDGRWVLYHEAETGRTNVYLASFAGGGKQQLTSRGGYFGAWRADGKAIYYFESGSGPMELPLTSNGAGLQPGNPRSLFKSSRVVATSFFSTAMDASRDGKRFVLNLANQSSDDSRAVLVLNWPSRLKK